MNPIAAGGVLQRWPLFLTTFTLLGLVFAVPRITAILSLRNIPLAGEELGSTEKRRLAYLGSARRVYQGGYRKVGLTRAAIYGFELTFFSSFEMRHSASPRLAV